MNLAPFTYCLPALLGYLLFVGISGRFAPHSRPSRLIDRPSWALGLWTGLAVVLVMTVGLHMAYTAPVGDVRALLVPSTKVLSALLLVGLLAWLTYRSRVERALETEAIARRDASIENARLLVLPAQEREETVLRGIAPARNERRGGEAERSTVVATFPAPDGPRCLDIPNIPPAGQGEPGTAIVVAGTDAVKRGTHETTAGTHEKATGAIEREMGTLHLALHEEARVREETEKHLRVTRRALARLEAQSRNQEGEKTDVLIALEEELECRIRESVAVESRATRETARRVELETAILALKRKLLAARNKARRNSASKAKAISTATRSIALAREAVKARARLEEKLHESRTALADRDATFDSLIAALEKEKNRTEEQVTTLAKQLVLHEKQLHARRNLEEVARSVEGKLATRLARKVARARPVVSGD